MKTAIVIAALAVIAGCASNPLQNARYWKIEQCAGAIALSVRFNKADGTTLATIPRASCSAVVTAEGKIERVANYRAEQIFIADPEALNAFATVDNTQRPIIVVTMGMLQALGSDDAAWAGLLGHEIAHHVRNHGAGRKEAKEGAQAAGQAAGNIIGQLIPGIGGFVAGNAANFAAANALYGAYTRPQEAEADQLGLEWMVAAGYDPRGMERLFDVLGKQGGGLPGFLSTHPGAEDRAKMVRDFIARSAQSTPSIANLQTSQQPSGGMDQLAHGGQPIPASNCADATSVLRLQTLCLTLPGCQREFEAIKRYCSNATKSGCVAAYDQLRTQCNRSFPSYREKSCVFAADEVKASCAD